MNQDASSEMEDLAAEYRLLDERRRRLEAQQEEHLQQATSTYETDRAAGQDDIKKKELALHELEARYNEELRVKREALQTALQCEATRKRKYDAEVQYLNQQLSGLKRLKQGNLELSRSLVEPVLQFGSTPETQTGASLVTDSPTSFEEDLRAQVLPASQSCPDSGFPNDRAASRSEPPYQSKTKGSEVISRQISGRDNLSAEGNGPVDLQPDDDPHQNELSDFSDIEGQSDESLTAEDEDFMGNKDASTHPSQSRPLTETIIPYEEVYQMARDPQAKYKHWIVEYPKRCGNWYIVRCLEHNLNWSRNPLLAGGKHLMGSEHMFTSRQPSLAIKELGTLVESCDQQKAEASNTEYDKALKQGYKPRNTMRKKKRARPNRPKSVTKKADVKCDQELGGSFEGVIDPVVGEIYHAWWDAEPRSWYLVVILPYLGDGDWKEVGLTGNLFTSGLRKEIPNCFKVVKVTTDSGKEALRLTWAEGYQDGGPKVRARKFPCLFLHDPLTIPSADKEFVLGQKAEVLAFRTAQQLRQRSTMLAPGLSKIGVDAYKGLAQDFEARLETIRAKLNATPEQDVEDNASLRAFSVRDQRNSKVTTSVENKESPCVSPASNVQDRDHHSTVSDLSMPGDGHRDISDGHSLAAQNPKVSLPSRLGNDSIGRYGSSQGAGLGQIADTRAFPSFTSTTSTTHSPSPNSEECGRSRAEFWTSQAPSIQAQPMTTRPQNEDSLLSSQKPSSTTQTADMTDMSNGGCGRIKETEHTSKPLNRARESTGTTVNSGPSQELKATKVGNARPFVPQRTANVLESSALAGEPRGPTALRPHVRFRKEDMRRSDGLSQEDRAPGLRNTVSTVDRDAVAGSAAQTSWTPAYSAMLRQPWRDPKEDRRRPKNG
ncbi:hypothetical protein LA080_011894 [Diaporthe eres]|nr:hypothetical protein LA080_011894 [Diaporthe eres]